MSNKKEETGKEETKLTLRQTIIGAVLYILSKIIGSSMDLIFSIVESLVPSGLLYWAYTSMNIYPISFGVFLVAVSLVTYMKKQ